MPVSEPSYVPTPEQRAAVEEVCAERRAAGRRITAIQQAGNLVRVVHIQGTSVEDVMIDATGSRASLRRMA